MDGLHAAQHRAETVLAATVPKKTFQHVGIYIDESGNAAYLLEPFAMAAIVALSPDVSAALTFKDELSRVTWPKASASDEVGRSRLAQLVATTAAKCEVTLRAVAVVRGDARSFPPGPQFVRSEWANLALDRIHRVLLSQTIAAALVYAVSPDELTDDAECSVVADVRSLPLEDLGTPVPDEDDLRAFGLQKFKNREGRELWGLLDTSGVYPIVDAVFLTHQSRLSRLRIVGARAAKGSHDGHPLVEWADHVAYTVQRDAKEKKRRPLESWATYLFTGAGFRFVYDTPLQNLLNLAPRAAQEAPDRALRDGAAEILVAEHERCSDRTPGGLPDRCLALVAESFDSWPQ